MKELVYILQSIKIYKVRNSDKKKEYPRCEGIYSSREKAEEMMQSLSSDNVFAKRLVSWQMHEIELDCIDGDLAVFKYDKDGHFLSEERYDG